MKKIGLFGLLFFFVLSFTSCNYTTYNEDIDNTPELPDEEEEKEDDFEEELLPNSQEVDFENAISTDDYFRIYEGNIWVEEATSDGIHANDYIRIDDGILKIRAKGEGFECEKGYVYLYRR